jgi:hypothetical protein
MTDNHVTTRFIHYLEIDDLLVWLFVNIGRNSEDWYLSGEDVPNTVLYDWMMRKAKSTKPGIYKFTFSFIDEAKATAFALKWS